MNNREYIKCFSKLSDHDWLAVLMRSLEQHVIDGLEMPGFPEDKIQYCYTGSAREKTLEEALFFYKEVKRFARKLKIDFSTDTAVMDFGCGWGRHYRFFLRDVSTEHFWGIDIDDSMIQVCKEAIKVGQFERCDISPPLRFPNDCFDIIYSYSVFSHLSEKVHLGWISEFSRILRPGGMLIVSTLKREHVYVWENYLKDENPFWLQALRKSGFEVKKAVNDLKNGEFLYCPIGGGGIRDSTFYGEAIIGPKYIERRWAPFMNFVEYVGQPSKGPQALIVMQKAM
jgi:SAM-dependent methyltransferase